MCKKLIQSQDQRRLSNKFAFILFIYLLLILSIFFCLLFFGFWRLNAPKLFLLRFCY